MPLLSVQNVITGIFALLIFATAALTLGLTISFSTTAMQNIGIDHAEALASKAKAQVEAFISQPLGQLGGMQDAALMMPTPLPNETDLANPLWYEAYVRRLLSDMSAV
eukprot:PhM_4_TR2131/c1_g4_i1/m.54225